jgi:hypothetical protein
MLTHGTGAFTQRVGALTLLEGARTQPFPSLSF